MLVIVSFFREIFDEVNMFAVTYINGTTCLSTEFMKMLIGKVSVELYFMVMVMFVFHIHFLPGHGTESVIMTITASLIKNSGTAVI